MNCLEFQDLWNEAFDQRSDGSSVLDHELELHANACESCRALSSRFQTLALAIGAVGRPTPSPGSADRILAGMARAQREARRRRTRLRWALASMATAASLFGLVRLGRVDPAPEPGRSRPISARPPRAFESALVLAGSASIELAREASAPATRIGREVLGGLAYPEPIDDNQAPAPDVPAPFRTVGERVNAGVRPISGSARRAFGFLLGPAELAGRDGL